MVVTMTMAQESINLAGKWSVQLQQDNNQERWSDHAKSVPVALPGSLTSNGIGNDIDLKTPWMGFTGRGGWATAKKYEPYRQPGNMKVPFWLQPDKYYKGKAWYRREVEIPASWGGKRVVLNLERCHWKTSVWVDGKKVGSLDSLCAPHHYDLTHLMTPGNHTLTVCVDNNYHIRVGPDAHSVTDHTQTNWNGLVGDLKLTATDRIWIDDIQAYPDIARKSVKLVIGIGNMTQGAFSGSLALTAKSFNGNRVHVVEAVKVEFRGGTGFKTVEVTLPMGADFLLWDEFDPALYELTATMNCRDRECRYSDEKSIQFGMRNITTAGRTFLVNGRPTIMRGTLDCAAFPKTGYPSMEVKEWRRIFKVAKSYGLNHIRFHSWCPPKAAFVAGDMEGMYLQPECPVWRGTCPHKEAAPVEPYLTEEAKRIFKEYGNHPSFVLFAHGNEPWELDQKWLNDTWVPEMKKLDSRHLTSGGAHYPLGENNDFHLPGGVGGFQYRYQGKFNTPPSTLRNYENQIVKKKAPAIAHETGQWCVFPNLKEIEKYTGCLKPRNYEIIRDFMKNNHLLDQAEDFLMASGKFQTLIYKESNEAFLRTRGTGGYQLLGLNDFPGQGTALVGVVDVFWEDKGYVTPAEFKRFNGPVVPLAIMDKRVWTTDETFTARIRIAQYSKAPLENARPNWSINDGKIQLVKGTLKSGTIPVGNDTELGTVTFPLTKVKKAAQLTLTVSIPGTDYTNAWRFWVYPREIDVNPGSVVICKTSKDALKALNDGKAVLLAPGPKGFPGNTAGAFAPIFWNKAWFPGQQEHTLGLLIEDKHPVFRNFPTRFHADWQWWDPMMQGKPIIMDRLDPELRPIVQPIDDWNQCRRLGLLFEARVGKGRLMVTSIDLKTGLDKRPVPRQLLAGILDYMNSDAFAPKHVITRKQLSDLVPYNALADLRPKLKANSSQTGYGPENMIDGNPETLWHTVWNEPVLDYPHEFTMTFNKKIRISGIRLLPRQDGNANGMVKDVEIFVSADGKRWGKPISKANLNSNQEWKQVDFSKVMDVKAIRVKALSPQNRTHPWASFAEVSPIIEE